MKIEFTAKTRFQDLDVGDVFSFADGQAVLMKIDSEGWVSLHNGVYRLDHSGALDPVVRYPSATLVPGSPE